MIQIITNVLDFFWKVEFEQSGDNHTPLFTEKDLKPEKNKYCFENQHLKSKSHLKLIINVAQRVDYINLFG